MLPLTKPADGYLRLSFSGQVDVAGAPAIQTWDLSAIPRSIREYLGFTRSFLVIARPLTAGLLDVGATVGFVNDADGIPSQLALSVTALAATDQLELDVWMLHSVIGAVSNASKCYFITTPGNAPTPQLMWGNNNIAATTTDRYLTPGYSDTQAETAPTAFRIARPGLIRNMRVRQNNPAGNGEPIVYALSVGGAPTALTCTLLSTDLDGSDLVNSVAVAAGALVDGILVTKANGIGTSPTNIVCTVEFA